MDYGYARVSLDRQREDRQLAALEECGILAANIYTDKQSGKDLPAPNTSSLSIGCSREISCLSNLLTGWAAITMRSRTNGAS